MSNSNYKDTVLTLDNGQIKVELMNYGAIIKSIILSDDTDIVLGYDTFEQYKNDSFYFGAVVGRYANRISKASYTLNGETYNLDKNDGKNSLHGGKKGLSTRYFDHEQVDNLVTFTTTIPDLDDGYSGTIDIKVVYELTNRNQLKITYHAISDKDTIVNLTNHSYFNMDGHNLSSLDNFVQINSSQVTQNDQFNIPTGKILDVTGTALDFSTSKQIGKDIASDDANVVNARGFDHNYIINDKKEMKVVAMARGSKCELSVETDCPCMQFYSGNYIATTTGKKGVVYSANSGFCFETGMYPDAINQPKFPSPVLKAEEEYNYTTIFTIIPKL